MIRKTLNQFTTKAVHGIQIRWFAIAMVKVNKSVKPAPVIIKEKAKLNAKINGNKTENYMDILERIRKSIKNPVDREVVKYLKTNTKINLNLVEEYIGKIDELIIPKMNYSECNNDSCIYDKKFYDDKYSKLMTIYNEVLSHEDALFHLDL